MSEEEEERLEKWEYPTKEKLPPKEKTPPKTKLPPPKEEVSFEELEKRIEAKFPPKEKIPKEKVPPKAKEPGRITRWMAERELQKEIKKEKKAELKKELCPTLPEIRKIKQQIAACPEICPEVCPIETVTGVNVTRYIKYGAIINGLLALTIFIWFLTLWISPLSPLVEPYIRISTLIVGIIFTGFDMIAFWIFLTDHSHLLFMFVNITIATMWMAITIFLIISSAPLEGVILICLVLSDIINESISYILYKFKQDKS